MHPKSCCEFDALICQVCREYLNTPMMTSCGHTFCSFCIRNLNEKCGTCNSNFEIQKIQKNYWAQNVLELFRDKYIAIFNTNEIPKEPESIVENEVVELENKCKRKNSELIENEPSKRTRSRSAREKKQSDDIVECPLCSRKVQFGNVNSHIDSDCSLYIEQAKNSDLRMQSRSRSNKSSQELSSSKVPNTVWKYKASVPYSIINLNQLKKLFKEDGIEFMIKNSKSEMIKIHTFWIRIWNSNVDSGGQYSISELKSRVRQYGDKKPRTVISDTTHHIKYKDEFDRMISELRDKRNSKRNVINEMEGIEIDSDLEDIDNISQ